MSKPNINHDNGPLAHAGNVGMYVCMYAHTELTRFQDDIRCSGPDFNRIIYAISKFQPDYLRRFKVLQCDTHLMLCMREMHVQESL